MIEEPTIIRSTSEVILILPLRGGDADAAAAVGGSRSSGSGGGDMRGAEGGVGGGDGEIGTSGGDRLSCIGGGDAEGVAFSTRDSGDLGGWEFIEWENDWNGCWMIPANVGGGDPNEAMDISPTSTCSSISKPVLNLNVRAAAVGVVQKPTSSSGSTRGVALGCFGAGARFGCIFGRRFRK